MDYKIIQMQAFKIIGFQKEFSYENSYVEIPKFWDEICKNYLNDAYAEVEPKTAYEKAIIDNGIGDYAVCIDDLKDGKFRYIIAGKYTGGEIPDGMTIHEFPAHTWAIFDCIGPNPETLQKVNTRIFNEWLPQNPDYELCENANIEWYDCASNTSADDYHSQIWIPIKPKNK